MRRLIYVVLCGLVLLALGCTPVFAADYEVYAPSDSETLDYVPSPVSGEINDSDFETWQDMLASPSEASPSSATYNTYNIQVMSSYSGVYDGSISTSVLTYFRGMTEKLPPSSHYVLFRQSQYIYRLVYGENLVCNGNRFTGTDMMYITYDTRDYVLSSGNEGTFSLSAGSYIVYSDIGDIYPVLVEGVKNYEFKALLFLCTMYLLFVIVRSFFNVGGYRI
ncbi:MULTISPECIES: hypothetical protein [Hungatella]|uniref:hypothetical protein n=1 Tax=Hungatella TaxID=1649459 RepID=UPI0006C4E9FC|nr:hypothetical protein [Hungatella hathewayi]CUP05494.1 Uncharacterised protein [Hungatella hathewayi]